MSAENVLSAGHAAPVTSGARRIRELYEEHYVYLMRTLRQLGVRECDVLDSMQKVLLTAHLRLRDFEGRSRLKTWLRGICRRVASDYRRSAAIRNEVTTDPALLESAPFEFEEPQVDAFERSPWVLEAALDKLPEPQRIVFVMSQLDETPGERIAALLDISEGTVRSRLRLARGRVRREVRRLLAHDAMYGDVPRS